MLKLRKIRTKQVAGVQGELRYDGRVANGWYQVYEGIVFGPHPSRREGVFSDFGHWLDVFVKILGAVIHIHKIISYIFFK